MTNEQLVDDLTTLIELHEERVARGADHGARDLAESVVTMLWAAGRLIPDEWEYSAEGSDRYGSGWVRNGLTREEAEKWRKRGYQVWRRTKPRPAGPWVEVPGD